MFVKLFSPALDITFKFPTETQVWINNHNSWTAGLRGQVTVSLTLLFLQQQKTLDIPLDRCSGQVQYQGHCVKKL